MVWEAAYAKVFNIQISADNNTWFPLYTNSVFTGGTSTIPNTSSLSGRYLKVNCVQRATTYGSSFYSFNLSGSFISSTNHVPVANAGNSLLTSGDAVLNGNSSVDADADPLVYKWEQLAGPSSATILKPTSALTQITGLKQGEYYFKLTVDDGKDVDFDIVKVVSNPATGLIEVSNNEIFIYPNPVHDTFYIQNTENKHIDGVQLYDMNGILLRVFSVNSNQVSLNGVSSGNYCIALLSKGRICKVVQILKK